MYVPRRRVSKDLGNWTQLGCQDLSLAGDLNGMKAGTRSGLLWTRVVQEMDDYGKRPPILVSNSVLGFLR